MKFTIAAGDLSVAAKAVFKAVEQKSTISILTHFKIVVGKNDVSLTGTDLDLETTMKVNANVDEVGSVCVTAKTFADALGKFAKDANVVLESGKKDQTVAVRCGRSRFSLQTLPVEDFPQFREHDSNHKFTIASGDLTKLLGKVQGAVSTEATRYYLNGAFLHAIDGKLRAVATDGHKLAVSEIVLPEAANGVSGIIIPTKTIERVLDAVKGVDSAEVSVANGTIRVEAGNVTINSKLIDGTFPDYARVVPDGNDKIAVLDAEALKQTVERVSIVSSDSKATKLNFGDGSLKLSVSNPNTGSAEEDLEADYNSEPLEIGFNGGYLSDVLGEIDTVGVEIKLADPSSPTIFRPAGDDSMFWVIMPMRT